MKKILFAIVIGIITLMPSVSFAVEEKFFEFATDVGVPIEVPSGSTAIQEVKIYNDHINAVDLWFDNSGVSGSATVSLLSASNALLASRTVAIGNSSPFYTGQRLHVNFNKTVDVNSGAIYKVKIASATPKLRLYAIKRVQFVEHDAPFPIDTAVGSSFLNDESIFSVFKFALYEDIDTEAPVITNASSSIASPDTMRIAFNANELVDRSISYTAIGSGAVSTIPFTGNYSICFENIFSCPTIIDTQRGTNYTYRLTVRDSKGNASFFDGAFASWQPQTPPPSQPPTPPESPQPSTPESPAVPFAIANARIVSVTDRSVKLSWDTNRAADSTLIISTDPLGAAIAAQAIDGTLELVHTVQVTGLSANKSYYVTIVSRDASAVMAAQVISFSTTRQTSTSLPAAEPLSTIQTTVVQQETTASAAVSWGVPAAGEPSGGYRIDIIDVHGNLFRTERVSAGTHSLEVAGLSGGEYYAIAYADKEGVMEKIAEPASISVRKVPPPIDTYELIKRPLVYGPTILFAMLIGGLYWYSKRQKRIIPKQ